jgi:hypothetical protein
MAKKKQNVKPLFEPGLLSDPEIREFTNDNMWADVSAGKYVCAFAREILRLRQQLREKEDENAVYYESYLRNLYG